MPGSTADVSTAAIRVPRDVAGRDPIKLRRSPVACVDADVIVRNCEHFPVFRERETLRPELVNRYV